MPCKTTQHHGVTFQETAVITSSIINIFIPFHFMSYLLRNSMDLSPSWEAAGRSATQKVPNVLWTMNVHFRVHSRPPLPLSWARLIQFTPPHPISLRSILILSTLLYLGLCSGLFPSDYSTKILYVVLFVSMRAAFPAHLILLDMIILIVLDDEYELWIF
jgi:hypothetical protein